MNVDVNSLATRHRQQPLPQSSQTIDHLPSSLVSINLNGRHLTSNIDSAIRYHVNGYHLRSYLQNRHSWRDLVWNSVDIRLFGRHFKNLSPQHQVSHLKFVHDQQSLGKRRRQQSVIMDPVLALRPWWKTSSETQFHFLQCGANPCHEALLATFQHSSMCDSDIHPVKYVLTAGGIQQWFTDPTIAGL